MPDDKKSALRKSARLAAKLTRSGEKKVRTQAPVPKQTDSKEQEPSAPSSPTSPRLNFINWLGSPGHQTFVGSMAAVASQRSPDQSDLFLLESPGLRVGFFDSPRGHMDPNSPYQPAFIHTPSTDPRARQFASPARVLDFGPDTPPSPEQDISFKPNP